VYPILQYSTVQYYTVYHTKIVVGKVEKSEKSQTLLEVTREYGTRFCMKNKANTNTPDIFSEKSSQITFLPLLKRRFHGHLNPEAK
jgi:hypothetical protein